jgi:hypothetical protein
MTAFNAMQIRQMPVHGNLIHPPQAIDGEMIITVTSHYDARTFGTSIVVSLA